jgi:hypothetical protein
MRPARPVEVDLRGASGDRVPISGDARGFEFGEAAMAEANGRRLRGVIGWDPRLGWVLVLDEPIETSLDAPLEDDSGTADR